MPSRTDRAGSRANPLGGRPGPRADRSGPRLVPRASAPALHSPWPGRAPRQRGGRPLGCRCALADATGPPTPPPCRRPATPSSARCAPTSRDSSASTPTPMRCCGLLSIGCPVCGGPASWRCGWAWATCRLGWSGSRAPTAPTLGSATVRSCSTWSRWVSSVWSARQRSPHGFSATSSGSCAPAMPPAGCR